jgi:ADP-ribose pyrophosphatase
VSFPRIEQRRRIPVSSWVTLVEKAVRFGPDGEPEIYHCLTGCDYVGMLARTPDGRIPIVRQFRPAVEEHTWEFPAGTVDPGETPEEAARRELREEAGLETEELVSLGWFHADTGRLEIAAHAYFATAGPPAENFAGEPGLALRYVTHRELKEMILCGEFRHQGHVALYAAALLRGLDLG